MENLVKQILGQLSDFQFRDWPKNWLLKLMSFFFALCLWYFVVGEDKVDMEIFIPIEITNLPRDMTISNQYKKQLEVAISGPRGIVRGLSRQHISRSVDLSKATPGKVVIRNEPDSIPLSRGIQVLRIQPTNITLQLERLVTKELPISAVTEGSLANGLELAGIHLEPASIKTTGPEAILTGEIAIPTVPIDISELRQSTSVQVTLDLKPNLVELIGELEVTANLTIQEKRAAVSVPQVTIEVDHGGERTIYWLNPPTVQVQAKIPEVLLKKNIAPSSLFQAKVRAKGLSTGTHVLPVEIVGKGNIQIISVSPEKISLKISDPLPDKKRKQQSPTKIRNTP